MSHDVDRLAEPPPIVEALYEPGRRGRWVAPVLLALAGWGVMFNIVVRSLILPRLVATGDPSAGGYTRAADVGAVLGAAFVVAGIALGARGMRRVEPVFHPDWTKLLLILACVAAAPIPIFWRIASQLAASGDAESARTFHYMMTLLGVIAAVLALLGALRVRRVRLAAVFSAALALLMLTFAPAGTLLSLVWFVKLRRRETSAV